MRSFTTLEVPAAAMGLRVNEGKTNTMEVMRNEERTTSPLEGNESVKKFMFNYLVVSLKATNEVPKEIRRRMVAANRCLFELSNFFRSRNLSRGENLRVYKARWCYVERKLGH